MQYILHCTAQQLLYGYQISSVQAMQDKPDIEMIYSLLLLDYILLSLDYIYIDCFVFVFFKLSVPPVRTLFKLQSGTVTLLSVTDNLEKIF